MQGADLFKTLAKKTLSLSMQKTVKGILARRKLGEIPDYVICNNHKKLRLDQAIPLFSPLATQIIDQGRTLLNYDRLYTLWQGLHNASHEAILIEVGVYRGGSSRFIAEALQQLKMPNTLYVCDTFEGHAAVDEAVDGGHQINKGFSDTSITEVSSYLSSCKNVDIRLGSIMDTAKDLPNRPVGLIHIDVDVYPATKFCLEYFCPRLERGGVVVIDDYGFTSCVGAKKATDEFIMAHNGYRFFHLMSGQGLIVKWT